MNPIHILLADDDEDDRFFFQRALSDADIPAVLKTVEDGQKLIDYLALAEKARKPDVIFLDINMPRKNGIECLKELRELPVWKSVPILMFSTSKEDQHVNEAFDLGANRYVCKPMNLKAQVKLLQEIFQQGWEKAVQHIAREQFLIE